LSVSETSSAGGHRSAVAPTQPGPPRGAAPTADLLEEYVRRTAAGDRVAFQSLYDLLSPYVQDSAACLFGQGDQADNITNAAFIDVWRLAPEYQPAGEGVREWVLNLAGRHTRSRYRPGAGPGADGNAGSDESLSRELNALLTAGRRNATEGPARQSRSE
jgi:DNA-directed RNA polymerase specialized sigma24 family protein